MTYSKYNLVVMVLIGTINSVGFSQQSADTSMAKIRNPALREELLAMEQIDQEVRNDWIKEMSSRTMDSLIVIKMDSVDSINTKRVKEMINRYGWPGVSVVGNDGAEAAFIVVQHSRDTLFQRSCLKLIRTAFKDGEVSGNDLALLTDRVRVGEGKAQLYGSQAKIVDGKIVVDPIEDEANVDKRRAELDLPPMAEYIKMLKEMYHLDVK